jgi:hypothetical protein
MNKTHQKILQAIFENPVNDVMKWSEIESLLIFVGCRVVEGSGSSVTFEKNGLKVFFHRPHPQKEALRYRVKDARLFLQKIGVTP